MSIESLDQWRGKKELKAGLRSLMPKLQGLPAAWQIMANDDQRYRDTPPALLHVMIAVLAVVQFGFVHRVFEALLSG